MGISSTAVHVGLVATSATATGALLSVAAHDGDKSNRANARRGFGALVGTVTGLGTAAAAISVADDAAKLAGSGGGKTAAALGVLALTSGATLAGFAGTRIGLDKLFP